jgi:hypothetical protein
LFPDTDPLIPYPHFSTLNILQPLICQAHVAITFNPEAASIGGRWLDGSFCGSENGGIPMKMAVFSWGK